MYFEKKNYLRTAHKAFYAIREYSFKHKQVKMQFEDQELKALRFYAYNLLLSHLRAWKKEA